MRTEAFTSFPGRTLVALCDLVQGFCSRSASSATFALNSAVNVRLFLMVASHFIFVEQPVLDDPIASTRANGSAHQ